MPPATDTLSAPRLAVRTSSKPGASSSALNSVFTPVMTLKRLRLSSATKRGISRGFVIEHVPRAELGEDAADSR